MAKEKNENPEEVGQPKGILDGSKETAQEKVNNTKQKVQKIKKVIKFFKRHPLIAKMLFWVILAIIVIVVFTMIIYAVKGGEESDASLSLDATIENMKKINLDEETGEDEEENDENNTKKMTAGTIKEEDGKYFYEILYGEDSEEKNRERINRVKTELSKKNIEIYNNQCLLFLAVMEENGLDLKTYNKEDLEAMYMFLKAEIATSSLDLGTEDETLENKIVPEGKTYSQDDYDPNDFSNDRINGTIKLQRITYNKVEESEEIGTKKQLKYISLEKFENLLNANDTTALDYFTLDEDNNLLVAGWRASSITYNILDCTIDGEEDTATKTELEEYYASDEVEHGSSSVYKYRSIPYLNYITKYTMPFSFLMSLLATTDNAQFCKDFVKVAEQSSITISLHEEYSHTETLISNVHNEIQKVYANINATVGGSVSNSEVGEWRVINTAGYSSTDAILQAYHGTGTPPYHPGPGATIYTWTYNNTEYKLQTYSGGRTLQARTRSTSSDVKTGNITNVFITKDRKVQGTMPEEAGRFRDITEEEYINHIDLFESLENYTVLRNKSYTVNTATLNKFYSYSLEVTEVDNWYEYYQKTYSKVKNDGDRIENDREEDITPQIYTNTITDTAEIENMNYIKEISQEEKERVIANTIGTEEFTDPQFDVTQIRENVFSYGKENIHTLYKSTKYKRAGTEKELVQVKVQEGNETGLLSIAADAFGAQNKKEEKENLNENNSSNNEDDEDKKEEVYETIDSKDNSFLYIYDQYEDVQKTFRSIDDWTYEMLNKRSSCKGMTNLLKYLIFLYDGTDLGITEYDLTLLKPDEFKSAMSRGSAIAEWLKSYEFENLREYRNGEITYEQFKSGYASSALTLDEDGKARYHMYRLDVKTSSTTDHSWNFSYGLLIFHISGNNLISNRKDEELQPIGYDNAAFEAEVRRTMTADSSAKYTIGDFDGDAIDKLMYNTIEDSRKEIKDYYEGNGLELENYEIDAIIASKYGEGGYKATGSSLDLLKKYKAGEATEEEMISKFAIGDFHPFTYRDWDVNNRRINLIELFFRGRYILSTGEEIDPNSFYGLNGGITTQAEADALEEYFTNEVLHVSGRFSGNPAMHNNWDVYNNLPEPWQKISRQPGGSGNLQMFQCTWWVAGRANWFLEQTDPTNENGYPGAMPNGGQWYFTACDEGYFECGSEPMPNSIGSMASGSSYGHVFYVEGVTDEGIWISECGSGSYWGGIQFWSNEILATKRIYGYIYLDRPL